MRRPCRTGDPVQVEPDEQIAAVTLQLRAGDHLPLRTFEDRELDSAGEGVQVDPLLAILGALADLPKGWRALTQLVVLAPAPHDWARAYQRLALERPLDQERRADTGPSLVGPLALLGLIGLYLVGLNVSEAWSRGDWFLGLELVFGTLAVIVGSIVVLRWLRKRELVDPRLVQAKLSRDACTVELRLAVIAPNFADSDAVQARLDRLVAAYRPFALATGNALVPRPVTRRRRTCGSWRRSIDPTCSTCASWPACGTCLRRATTSSSWSAPPPAAGCPCQAPSLRRRTGQAAVSASRRTRASPCRSTCRQVSCAAICWRWPRRAAASRACCCAWCIT